MYFHVQLERRGRGERAVVARVVVARWTMGFANMSLQSCPLRKEGDTRGQTCRMRACVAILCEIQVLNTGSSIV